MPVCINEAISSRLSWFCMKMQGLPCMACLVEAPCETGEAVNRIMYFIILMRMSRKLLINSKEFWIKWYLSTLRLRQNGHHGVDNTFKCFFLNENVRILIEISLKFYSKGLINNIPATIQVMAWCQPGNKPLSGPMMISLLMHNMHHSASMH